MLLKSDIGVVLIFVSITYLGVLGVLLLGVLLHVLGVLLLGVLLHSSFVLIFRSRQLEQYKAGELVDIVLEQFVKGAELFVELLAKGTELVTIGETKLAKGKLTSNSLLSLSSLRFKT